MDTSKGIAVPGAYESLKSEFGHSALNPIRPHQWPKVRTLNREERRMMKRRKKNKGGNQR